MASRPRPAEFTGHYAADGRLTLRLDVAENDPAGTWQIKARELATGRQSAHHFRAPPPNPWPPTAKPMPAEAADAVQPKG